MNRQRAIPIGTGLLLTAAIAGCGQRGPLYLPDQEPGTVITRPGPQTPESTPQPGTQIPDAGETRERDEEESTPPPR
ncbi:MAG TPA: lipoprotein [Steroidobacteraceae bacterium]